MKPEMPKCTPKTRKIFLIISAVLFVVVIATIIAASVSTRTPEATLGPQIDPSLASHFLHESRDDKHVIVIGAGAAGLFAGYTLTYLGIDCTILEASDNFGGRVQELPAGDFVDVPLDLGAEWIHVNPRVLQEMLLFDDKVDIETIVYQPQTISTYRNNRRWRNNWMRFFYREHKFYHTTWHSYLKDYVYPYVADQLELNAAVTSIDYSSEDSITVESTDGRTFVGSHVIVATPVTTLQDGDIKFSPPLPGTKQVALQQVYMTAGLKVWVEFDKKFYPDMQIPGTISTFLWEEGALYFDALFRKPSDRNVLALFQVGGEGAYKRVAMDDERILQNVLDELDKIFDGEARKHYVKGIVQNWSSEPFIKGAYSYNDYNMAPLREPIDSRIYFCGEYLNYDDQSTVHGAAISGRNAARRLVLDSAP